MSIALRRTAARLLAALVCLALLVGWIASNAVSAETPATTASATAAASPSGDREVVFHKVKATKILFLGNSITLHGPAPAIGWMDNWGMAASAQEKDYVHLVLKAIATSTGKEPQSMISNVADFERQFTSFDLDAGLKQALAFKADLVVVAIGENVPVLSSEQAKASFQASMNKFLEKLKANGNPVLVVRSCFWHDPIKDAILKQACSHVGGVFVDAGSRDEANYARSERKFSHAGVAAHPGDRGMQAIADAILKALSQHEPRSSTGQ